MSSSFPLLNPSNFFSNYSPHPFYQSDVFDISYTQVTTKTKQERLLIRLGIDQIEYPSLYNDLKELSSFFFKPIFRQRNNILKIDRTVFGLINNVIECWIICEFPSTLFLTDYVNYERLHMDEIHFMFSDFLNIANDISFLTISSTVNIYTVMLKREPASPYPKAVLSPLAFVLPLYYKNINEITEPPFISIGSLMELVNYIPYLQPIITAFASNQQLEYIMQLKETNEVLNFTTIPMTSIQEYQPISLVGSGGYGHVIKAKTSTDSIVAIKESGKKYIETLKREAVIMRICDHPNVVKFINFGIAQDSFAFKLSAPNIDFDFPRGYLVMEYCSGGNLNDFIDTYATKGELLPLDLVAALFKQIACCQHYLHFEKGLIHRDIKLDNFLLTPHQPYPIVKICDFGFSRSIASEMETYKGTPLFSAPEIMLKTPYSSKCDLYSIGVCLYRLMTCQYPFGTNEKEFFQKMRQRQEVLFYPCFTDDIAYSSIIDLIHKLMRYDEDERISWEEFYQHDYMLKINAN